MSPKNLGETIVSHKTTLTIMVSYFRRKIHAQNTANFKNIEKIFWGEKYDTGRQQVIVLKLFSIYSEKQVAIYKLDNKKKSLLTMASIKKKTDF